MKPTVETRPKKGGSYPPEFREEAVRYWLSSGKKAGEVAAELGVSDWSLQRWRDQMEGKSASSSSKAVFSAEFTAADALALAREVGQLKRELESMTRQRDILKKAISIFSQENPPGGLR